MRLFVAHSLQFISFDPLLDCSLDLLEEGERMRMDESLVWFKWYVGYSSDQHTQVGLPSK